MVLLRRARGLWQARKFVFRTILEKFGYTMSFSKIYTQSSIYYREVYKYTGCASLGWQIRNYIARRSCELTHQNRVLLGFPLVDFHSKTSFCIVICAVCKNKYFRGVRS